MKKSTFSPASAKLRSGITPKSMTPKLEDTSGSTIGVRLSPEDARELAAMLLAVSYDRDGGGEVLLTGHLKEQRLTVLRRSAKVKV